MQRSKDAGSLFMTVRLTGFEKGCWRTYLRDKPAEADDDGWLAWWRTWGRVDPAVSDHDEKQAMFDEIERRRGQATWEQTYKLTMLPRWAEGLVRPRLDSHCQISDVAPATGLVQPRPCSDTVLGRQRLDQSVATSTLHPAVAVCSQRTRASRPIRQHGKSGRPPSRRVSSLQCSIALPRLVLERPLNARAQCTRRSESQTGLVKQPVAVGCPIPSGGYFGKRECVAASRRPERRRPLRRLSVSVSRLDLDAHPCRLLKDPLRCLDWPRSGEDDHDRCPRPGTGIRDLCMPTTSNPVALDKGSSWPRRTRGRQRSKLPSACVA